MAYSHAHAGWYRKKSLAIGNAEFTCRVCAGLHPNAYRQHGKVWSCVPSEIAVWVSDVGDDLLHLIDIFPTNLCHLFLRCPLRAALHRYNCTGNDLLHYFCQLRIFMPFLKAVDMKKSKEVTGGTAFENYVEFHEPGVYIIARTAAQAVGQGGKPRCGGLLPPVDAEKWNLSLWARSKNLTSFDRWVWGKKRQTLTEGSNPFNHIHLPWPKGEPGRWCQGQWAFPALDKSLGNACLFSLPRFPVGVDCTTVPAEFRSIATGLFPAEARHECRWQPMFYLYLQLSIRRRRHRHGRWEVTTSPKEQNPRNHPFALDGKKMSPTHGPELVENWRSTWTCCRCQAVLVGIGMVQDSGRFVSLFCRFLRAFPRAHNFWFLFPLQASYRSWLAFWSVCLPLLLQVISPHPFNWLKFVRPMCRASRKTIHVFWNVSQAFRKLRTVTNLCCLCWTIPITSALPWISMLFPDHLRQNSNYLSRDQHKMPPNRGISEQQHTTVGDQPPHISSVSHETNQATVDAPNIQRKKHVSGQISLPVADSAVAQPHDDVNRQQLHDGTAANHADATQEKQVYREQVCHVRI